MSAAQYNRGSKLLSADIDTRMPVAQRRADAQAHLKAMRGLTSENLRLKKQLQRARRYIAAAKLAREQEAQRLAAELRGSKAAIMILVRIAERHGAFKGWDE